MSVGQYSSSVAQSEKGYNHRTGDGERIFSPVYADVWDTHLKHMKGSDVKVYVALLMHTTQRDRTWFLSIEELAEDAGVSRDTARVAKDRLVEAGLIEQWWRYRNEHGEYRITDTPPLPRMQAKNLYKVNVKPLPITPGGSTPGCDDGDEKSASNVDDEFSASVGAENQHLLGAENHPLLGAENQQQTITPHHNPINREVVKVLPKVKDARASDVDPLEDFSIPSEEEPPALRASGGTTSGFNESKSKCEGVEVVSEPDHPWSESVMLNHRPEELRSVAKRYAKKPHASRCPVHENVDRVGPCQNCKQVRLYAEEEAERLAGRYSEERARRKQEINVCGLCDPRGIASYHLPDGSLQAVTCHHSARWLDEFVTQACERFLAERSELDRHREESRSSKARAEAVQKVRNLRKSRIKALRSDLSG